MKRGRIGLIVNHKSNGTLRHAIYHTSKSRQVPLLTRFAISLLSFLFIIQLVQGVPVMPPETELANQALQPLTDALQPLLTKLSLIVGGIFGLYVILILVRIYYDRKTLRVLQDIRYDLDHLNAHYNLPASRDNVKGWRRLFNFLVSPFRSKPGASNEKKGKQK